MKLVPCYDLLDVLSRRQAARVRPFLRATFTEMWEACCLDWSGGYVARHTLRAAAGRKLAGPANAREGRQIEKALYARAKQQRRRVVMGPRRTP